MFEYMLLAVCVFVGLMVLLFFIFEYRSLGNKELVSPAPLVNARISKRKAAKLLKKVRKKNKSIGSVELTEEYSIFKNKIPMWRSYYASPVSKRRKYKPGRG